MRIPTTLRLFVAILSLTSSTALSAAAAPSHIRSTSPALRALIDLGLQRSSTFHALVDELEASDVIVYVKFGTFDEPHIDGKIAFVGAGGGLRYLQVVVAPLAPLSCLAILGHELRHAVEIAGTPSVVNTETLAQCYARIGFNVPPYAERFDTRDAVESGRRVLLEATAMRGSDGIRIDAMPGSW